MIIDYFLNVAIVSWIIIQYSNNTIALLQLLIRHLCCLEIMENKVSVFADIQQQGEEQAAPSDYNIGDESPLQAYLWKRWHWH